LGIGDWGLGPIPNPQSPIPKSIEDDYIFFKFNKLLNLLLNILYFNK